MGSDWLFPRGRLLFSMSLVKEESILSLRIRSVLLLLKSSLSAAETHGWSLVLENVSELDSLDSHTHVRTTDYTEEQCEKNSVQLDIYADSN